MMCKKCNHYIDLGKFGNSCYKTGEGQEVCCNIQNCDDFVERKNEKNMLDMTKEMMDRYEAGEFV